MNKNKARYKHIPQGAEDWTEEEKMRWEAVMEATHAIQRRFPARRGDLNFIGTIFVVAHQRISFLSGKNDTCSHDDIIRVAEAIRIGVIEAFENGQKEREQPQ